MNDTIFDKTIIKSVVAHMNEDHSEACLAISQALGKDLAAVEATMQGMDAKGADFITVAADGQVKQVRVEFSKPITRESQIRGHLVALAKQARVLLNEQNG